MVATKTPPVNGTANKANTKTAKPKKADSKPAAEAVVKSTAKDDAKGSQAKAKIAPSPSKVAKVEPSKTEPKPAAKLPAKTQSATSPIKKTETTMAKTKSPSKKAAKAVKKKHEVAATEQMYEDNETLKTAVQQIEAQFGTGSIMTLNKDAVQKVRGVSTGSLSLDMALGGSGLPCGRIIEVYGPESSGKTTLALHAVAQAQKKGGIAAIVDAEHAFDPTWAKKLGVSLDTLLVSQPSSGEEAMQIVEMLVKSNAVDVIIVDSVAALVPKKELEGEIGDSHVGLQARLMSQSMRKLTGAISRSKTCTIFINQIREKIGVMFGSPETTPGGRALKFYSSVRIDVRRIGALKDGDVQVGQRVKAKIVKNKVAPPFRIAEFDMMHDCGISYEGDVLDLGKEHKIVQQSGAWFKYGSTHLGQGKEKARNFLKENPDICEEIRGKVMEAGGYAVDLAEFDGAEDGADLGAETT
jgi:recombination protein RecA